MFCTKCGTQIPDESRFCYNCGTPLAPLEQKDQIAQTQFDTIEPSISGAGTVPPTARPAPQQPTPQQTAAQPAAQPIAPGKAEDGLCGMLGFIFAFFFPLVGLVLSILGVYKKKNHGFAVAGVIISIVMLALEATITAILVNHYCFNFDFYPYIYY